MLHPNPFVISSTVEGTLTELIEKHTLPEVINWVRRLVIDDWWDAESESEMQLALFDLEQLLAKAVFQAGKVAEIQQRENEKPSKQQKAKRRIKVHVG